ncbi:2-oxoisovalerate dehydrogenase subunit alpha, mitochondrial isoform X2 [Adelges cooleyi]|uniref:2-oxoisovalerate dehydrogenase subunit alpha, mitochondrial isoform X2 n=1 Tax=Adelges cooleyi TaxID=133065 RepID=UPI00217FC2B0|nr:2-oxoisovalerate dehydrogenase subunit alpha, mitochondrial isoform X2 [Adelges cooleyi]
MASVRHQCSQHGQPNVFPKCIKFKSSTSTNLEQPKHIGIKQVTYTNKLDIFEPSSLKTTPIFRVLDCAGELNKSAEAIIVPNNEELLKMYKSMVLLSVMDKLLYESQRQGRISFYMTNEGEEAVQIGSAAGLLSDDLIYGQYREAGVLLYRGFTPERFMNQCFGNIDDEGKGRQMPVHYGSKTENFVTISSPLTTQLPQAVGSAYSFKRLNNGRCTVVYFGEGAASEGDAHAAFNFAATLECPVIFVCRNNGYAISTPANEQFRGDGIVSHGPGYGIATVRVDGNDILAVYNAMVKARQYVMTNTRPLIFEAMTYRRGHHSTSDDSTAYRSKDEMEQWASKNPIRRLKLFLEKKNLWNDQDDLKYASDTKKKLMQTFTIASKKKKPDWRQMFYDVYDELPEHLMEQMKGLEEHLKQNSQHYPEND